MKKFLAQNKVVGFMVF